MEMPQIVCVYAVLYAYMGVCACWCVLCVYYACGWVRMCVYECVTLPPRLKLSHTIIEY